MSAPRRYSSVRQYVRVVRRHWMLIILVTLAFGGAAGVIAMRTATAYVAYATVAFRDTGEDAGIIGGVSLPAENVVALTVDIGRLLRGPQVLRLVLAQLGASARSPQVIATAAGVQGNFTSLGLVIVASSQEPTVAAQVANAFAHAVVVAERDSDRALYRSIAAQLALKVNGEARDSGVSAQVKASDALRLSRLNALASIAQPASLGSPAAVPGARTSHNTKRNVLIGLADGLVVGILIAFIRDALDRRLLDARDVREAVDLPVLTVVPRPTLRRLGSSGGRDSHREQDLEAFRFLRSEVRFLDVDRPPACVAVTSAAPGEAKSTVAAGLARAYALAGLSTLLLECDLRRPGLAHRVALDAAPGLADYLAGNASASEIVRTMEPEPDQSADRPPDEAPLSYIVAGSPPTRPAELLATERLADLLADVRRTYDVVVLDTAPLLAASDTLQVLPHVDATVLCLRVGWITREQAAAAAAAIRRVASTPAGLVVTGVSTTEMKEYGHYAYA